MGWRKLGRVFAPGGDRAWAVSHAFCPTTMQLDEDRIRVYAAFVDARKVGRVGYVDVNAADPTEVIDVSEQPVLDIGEPGMFDDNGVTPLSLCRDGDSIRLYYAGWQLGVKVRYFLFLGLAESSDGGASFTRHSRVPVLDRSDSEPVVRSSAHVRRRDDRWQMWYAGGESWTEYRGRSVPSYSLRYLESDDGVHWGPEGEVSLEAEGDEFGFARPYVIEEGGRFRMWYSIRSVSKGYRLGYAESADGREWERLDGRAGLEVSESGWDSEMVGLTCIERTRYGTYLFYNGNNYGESGFGVAVAEGE